MQGKTSAVLATFDFVRRICCGDGGQGAAGGARRQLRRQLSAQAGDQAL